MSCVTVRKSFNISTLSSLVYEIRELDNLFAFDYKYLKVFAYAHHKKKKKKNNADVTARVPYPPTHYSQFLLLTGNYS